MATEAELRANVQKMEAAVARLEAVPANKRTAKQTDALIVDLKGVVRNLKALGAAESNGDSGPSSTPAEAIAQAIANGNLQEVIDSGALGNPLQPYGGVDYSHYTGSFLGQIGSDPQNYYYAYRNGQQIAEVPVDPGADTTALNRTYGVGNQ